MLLTNADQQSCFIINVDKEATSLLSKNAKPKNAEQKESC